MPSKKHLPRPILAVLAVNIALMMFGVTGCHLGQPASASFASINISGKSDQEICAAAVAVFHEAGYQYSPSNQGLVFEKEGTRANTISRDGIIATQAGARTIVRVRAELVDLGDGSRRLQCHAFMVSGAGDSFFEEEHRLANYRSRPYQNLLDDVAKKLKQP